MPRGSQIIDLGPPTDGARSDLPGHKLPLTAVIASATRNVVLRSGSLVNRPGLEAVGAATVTGRPMGGFVFRPNNAARFTIVGTTSHLYSLDENTLTWDDVTGTTTPIGDATNHWRFVVFPDTAGTDHLIAVNDANVPQTWDGVAADFSDLAGSPPRATDVTISTNRVILANTVESGTRHQYRIRWSNFDDHETWDADDFADLSDTSDPIIGARALSRVAFAVYKKETQWVGLAQAGLFPFRFELQDQKPGPVSAACIVAAEGRHYYLGQDGSIYVFDGIRTTHVGEPIRTVIQANIDFPNIVRTFGVYLRRDREIYWFFCQPGMSDPDFAISMNIDSGRFFPHEIAKPSSCGFNWDFQALDPWDADSASWNSDTTTWDEGGQPSVPVEMLGGVDTVIRRFGQAADDDGTSPTATWRWQNMVSAGPGKRFRVQSLDTFISDPGSALTIQTRIGTTDTLANTPTFPSDLTDTFDANTDTVHQAAYDQDTDGAGTGLPEARFITVDYSVSTSVDWSFEGAVLRGYVLETE